MKRVFFTSWLSRRQTTNWAKKRQGRGWLLGGVPFLIVFSLACQLSSIVITPTASGVTAVPPASSPDASGSAPIPNPTQPPQPGSSRANPIPVGETAVTGRFAVTILETLRGDAAWQAVHLANLYNAPAPEGWEYLLVKMRVANQDSGEDKQYVALNVTGDGRVLHFDFDSGVVSPDPALETNLSGGVESEGWEAYRIRQGEGNLILVVDDQANYETPPTYMAIDEGASVTVDPSISLALSPTEWGLDRAHPVPFGQTATGEDWQIIVEDVIDGDQAWEMVLDANQFNDPPPDGWMYWVIKVRVRFIGLVDGEQTITKNAFSLLTNSGEELPAPIVVSPEPELFFDLYAGGEVAGIIVLQAPAEAKNLTLYFDPPMNQSGVNGRYLSVSQGR